MGWGLEQLVPGGGLWGGGPCTLGHMVGPQVTGEGDTHKTQRRPEGVTCGHMGVNRVPGLGFSWTVRPGCSPTGWPRGYGGGALVIPSLVLSRGVWRVRGRPKALKTGVSYVLGRVPIRGLGISPPLLASLRTTLSLLPATHWCRCLCAQVVPGGA